MTQKNVTEIDEDFDWGFSIVDENEIPSVNKSQKDSEQLHEEVQFWKERAERIYNLIQPLLNNLSVNPEKEYILWPNRIEKIEEFRVKLQSLIR